ncbi:MAG: GNAT family N-acetyltransferase [Janthinobacterium lividum]
MSYQLSSEILIQSLKESYIDLIVSNFALHNWPKPRSIFEKYLEEQEQGRRLIWLAYQNDNGSQSLTGYVTLTWHSLYPIFQQAGIPEIMDLNVLPPYRGQGIGSKLLQTAEDCACQKVDEVGIGVGLYSGYGAAQRLYIARGYQSNGQGITYNYQTVNYGDKAPLDDDLILWLTKRLKS